MEIAINEGKAVAPELGNSGVNLSNEVLYCGRKNSSIKIGSRITTIKVLQKFSLLPKEAAAKFIRDEVTKKIGSAWKKGTRDIIRGLDLFEEAKFLPVIISTKPDGATWQEDTRQFWANFFVEVPINGGLELETGFKLINPVTNEVEPINLDHYMKAKFADQHPHVAKSDNGLANVAIYSFVMIDKVVESERVEKEFTARNKAGRYFIKLVESEDQKEANKIDWILETAGGEDSKGISVTNLSKVQKSMKLEEMKDKDPTRFITILTDTNLETKALIRKCIQYGCLIQEGNSFFMDNKVIGSNLMDTVGYLDNAANQKDKLLLMERLKGALI